MTYTADIATAAVTTARLAAERAAETAGALATTEVGARGADGLTRRGLAVLVHSDARHAAEAMAEAAEHVAFYQHSEADGYLAEAANVDAWTG